jgi:hypothetical protein
MFTSAEGVRHSARQEWRIQLWVDPDQNIDTGYITSFAIGADSLLEVSTLYDYAGSTPGDGCGHRP